MRSSGSRHKSKISKHKEELKALQKLSGIVKVNKKVAKEITEECNGKVYIKRHF